MFCALLVGNKVVYMGMSSPSPGARCKGGSKHPCQSQSLHAEMDALRYLRRHNHNVRKAHLVVLRPTLIVPNDHRQHDSRRSADGQDVSSGDGDNLASEFKFGNSRPCRHCIDRIIRYQPKVASVTFCEDTMWHTEMPGVCAAASRMSSGDRWDCLNS